MYKNKILSGKKYLIKTILKIKKKIKKIIKKNKRKPSIIIINIGKCKSSNIYIKKKCYYFNLLNIKYKIYKFDKKEKEKNIINLIKKKNKSKNIDCILIQLPLPKNFNYNKIINNINPKKDVDGLHYKNIGKLLQGFPKIRSCTSYGVIKLLKIYKIKLIGLNVVIINSSNLIGKPIMIELINKKSTVTIINSKTKNIKIYTKKADILITAIGKYNYIKKKWIKKNSIIIDIGININKKNKIIGDINIKSIIKKIKYITPVPGGIGLMTISILLKNIIKIYYKNNK